MVGMREDEDFRWLETAVELAWRCPPSDSAFSVGSVIVGQDGRELARGYSREQDPHDHAEEVALRKAAAAGLALGGATLYSSLEPCGQRSSRPRTCAELILDSGISRVVYAWAEPSLFVEGSGEEILRAGGVEVTVIDQLAARARAANAHLPGIGSRRLPP